MLIINDFICLHCVFTHYEFNSHVNLTCVCFIAFSLFILSLCECSITEKQCVILTSALKSNPSHLRELDFSRNELNNTGVNSLCDILKDPHCKLERLR